MKSEYKLQCFYFFPLLKRFVRCINCVNIQTAISLLSFDKCCSCVHVALNKRWARSAEAVPSETYGKSPQEIGTTGHMPRVHLLSSVHITQATAPS